MLSTNYRNVNMKSFLRLLRRHTRQQSIANEADHGSEDAKSESDDEDTVGIPTIKLEKELWPDDEDIGVGPYNTGRFDNENE